MRTNPSADNSSRLAGHATRPLRLLRHLSVSILSLLLFGSSIMEAAEIGVKVADFTLMDTAGNAFTLKKLQGRIVVIVFWAFKCPVSLAYDDRLGELHRKYGPRGVAIVGIDSNSNESAEEVRRNVSNLKLPFPVLLDSDGALADKLTASHTPSLFILDGGGVLRYRGALDNNKGPNAPGRIAYAEQALEALVSGQKVEIPETRVFGCPLIRKTIQ